MVKVTAAAAAADVETIRQDSAEAEFPTLVQVILAGGSGTRLWPVSREQFPKQLIDVIGNQTLLQATMDRSSARPPPTQLRFCNAGTQTAQAGQTGAVYGVWAAYRFRLMARSSMHSRATHSPIRKMPRSRSTS